MSDQSGNPALHRILRTGGNGEVFAGLLALGGADLTTLLLGAAAQRAEPIGCADVMRQYQQDRFVAAATVDGLTLARVELGALEAAAPRFEPVALAPLVPFGTHRAIGDTPQNNVVSTMRNTEVTADPTTSLALEAAVRRSTLLDADPKSAEVVRLAAVHRVTRAQHFSGPRSFAHFSLFGIVSAGRDRGNYLFEIESVEAQLRVVMAAVRAATEAPIVVQVSPFNETLVTACADLCARLEAPDVTSELWLEREHGRGYYRNICFKLHVGVGDDRWEVGDGGDVWWTQDLLQSRKERAVIGGLGLDRLAMLLEERAG